MKEAARLIDRSLNSPVSSMWAVHIKIPAKISAMVYGNQDNFLRLNINCGDGGNRTLVYMSKTYESTLCRLFSAESNQPFILMPRNKQNGTNTTSQFLTKEARPPLWLTLLYYTQPSTQGR